MTNFQSFVQPLIDASSQLEGNLGQKVIMINQVTNPAYTLLTSDDLNNPYIIKKKLVSIDKYIKEILIEEAEKIWDDQAFFQNAYEIFRDEILSQLDLIQNLVISLSSAYNRGHPKIFLHNFSNGVLNDPQLFKQSFEEVISCQAKRQNLKFDSLTKIQDILDHHGVSFENIKTELTTIFSKLSNNFPKTFLLIDHIAINKGKIIPTVDGIDFHPHKNIYVASTNCGGNMIIRDLNKNVDISKIKMRDYSGGYADDNYLWSPCGSKILVSTFNPPWIFVYNEYGELEFSIEQTHESSCGYGAIWLNSLFVAIGYEDGSIKIFDMERGEAIGSINLKRSFAYAMQNLSESELLIGDGDGFISQVNWKSKNIDWSHQFHKKDDIITIIRVSFYKITAISGSQDSFVKCFLINNRFVLWEFEMNSEVYGLEFCANENAIIALSRENQLILLNASTGAKLFEYNNLSADCRTLRFNNTTDELLVGNMIGTIRRLRLIY